MSRGPTASATASSTRTSTMRRTPTSGRSTSRSATTPRLTSSMKTPSRPPSEPWSALRAAVQSGELPLIDVRAPKEHALGRIPGADSVPLLDDAERHAVGLCYKQDGQRPATQLGIELFAAKASRFLDEVA